MFFGRSYGSTILFRNLLTFKHFQVGTFILTLIQIGKLIWKCRVGKTSSLIYETVVGRGATFPE